MASKSYVKYQDTPKDGKQCSGCSMFRPPESCTYVDGKINPQGYCVAWEKANAKASSR